MLVLPIGGIHIIAGSEPLSRLKPDLKLLLHSIKRKDHTKKVQRPAPAEIEAKTRGEICWESLMKTFCSL